MRINCKDGYLEVKQTVCEKQIVKLLYPELYLTIGSDYYSIADSKGTVVTIERSNYANYFICNVSYGNINEFEQALKDLVQQYNLISSDNIVDNSQVTQGGTLTEALDLLLELTGESSGGVVYVENSDSPYVVTDESILICDTTAGDVDIKLPNLADENTGKTFKILFYAGDFNVNISTVNGTDLIGDKTVQTIRTTQHSIEVVANKLSAMPAYLIGQDSRGSLKQKVNIYKASDLAGNLSSDVIYVIDADIDLGTTEINLPATGGLTFGGLGQNVSKLRSSENNYTMFNGTINGDVFFVGDGLTIEISGANSKVFDLTDGTGNSAIEIDNVQFTNTTEIGTLVDFRQGLLNNTFFLNVGEGFSLGGAWNGFAIFTTLVLNHGSGNFFTGLPSLTFSSRFVSNANVNLTDPTSVAYDFQVASFQKNSLILKGGAFNDVGMFSAISADSDVALFSDNGNEKDTYIGGKFTITTEASTGALVQDAFVKMTGTTTASDLVHFSDGGTNARLTSTDGGVINAIIYASFGFASNNNRVIGMIVRHFDSAGNLKAESVESTSTANGGILANRAEGIVVIDTFNNVVEGDYFEPYIRNRTDGNAITPQEGGNFVLTER